MTMAFVYKWTHKQTGKWYIGKHSGAEDDGYICSSFLVKPMIEEAPNDWERTILTRGSWEQMGIAEILHLKKTDAVNNPQSLNQTNGSGKIVFKDRIASSKPKVSIRAILEQE